MPSPYQAFVKAQNLAKNLFLLTIAVKLDEKGKIISTATKFRNLYYLNFEEKQVSAHAARTCSNNDTREEIWHRRYGHVGAKNLQKLVREIMVNGLDFDVTKVLNFCEPCPDGKHHRHSFPKYAGRKSNELLGVVHSDCGKIESKSLSGCDYFVTFIYDKSRYVWTYMLKHKGEVYYSQIMVENILQKK